MLDSLHIENVAVAKNVNIEFGAGFNVLTGETGAGKSIIIDSIGLILGDKASKEMIRHGADKATVSAYFSNLAEEVYTVCDEQGLYYDREDIFSVSRTVTVDGRSSVKINSKTASLSQLKLIAPLLVNIHGQNENHSFMDKSNHLRLLDEYIEIENVINEYKAMYKKLSDLKSEISSLNELNKQKDMMYDILKFQIKEISSAKITDLEEEKKLTEKRIKLRSSEKIVKLASNAYKVLCKNESGISATYLLDKAIDSLSRLSDVIPEASELSEKLKEFNYEITDIGEKALEYADFEGEEPPEIQLSRIEERLSLLQKLKRKYGGSEAEILKFKEDAQIKLDNLEKGEVRLDELKHQYKKLYTNALNKANDIHNIRVKGAEKLSVLVMDTLKFLDMPKVRFEICVRKNESNGKVILNQYGCDDVEFLIATNVGEELAPMNRIASGGELSRIMLALKNAMSDKNGAGTVIFDEIDTGVSGSTSQRIGIKLFEISLSTQTICVTHSPQIAALAQNHYFIKKTEIDERAEAKVFVLSEDERVNEIARIIGGINLTTKQFDAARELILQSNKIKTESK
ncbi:MAG: DNA repair protein RecN [Clostridia bacterium]|nr:DNA repair protein RecN [Clostridia bacterium]